MIEEILRNLYRIEIPLPDSLLKSVNSYVIKDNDRDLVVDTGMHNEASLNAMRAAHKKLDVDLGRSDFFITHFHIDHFGLVPRLAQNETVVYMNELERESIEKIRSGAFTVEIKDFLCLSGFPEKDPARILRRDVEREIEMKTPLRFSFVRDAEMIERGGYRFACVVTPGHSRGHTCLYDGEQKILISGDHLLGDITPGIHGRVDGQNPLKQYLESLGRLHTLNVDIVLPGHRNPFRGFRKRIEEIQTHHRQRNQEVLAILQERSGNAYEIASHMTWNTDCDSWECLPLMQSFFATGEAFAHLRYLEEEGRVKRRVQGKIILFSLDEPYGRKKDNA
ncbi:MAG TPA: MBL fold metallo-hydrolase [Syntrophorhabdaceae bacterium]|nr:MBL fold metallo-hydrolase [Syntrophorhabdaceae bacterium]